MSLESLDILAQKLDSRASSNYVFHSDLTILGKDLLLLRGRLIQTLTSKLNQNILAIPAFNLNTNSSEQVDIRYIDKSMGALPVAGVEACNLSKGYRTPNPIHSYSFFPDLKDKDLINNFKSFGPNSVFDYFLKNDFVWVNFGASADSGFTFFHHLECMADVPYREKIIFKRKIRDGSKRETINFEYFARKDNEHKQNFSLAVDYLTKMNAIEVINVSGKSIFIGSLKNISHLILDKLAADPYFFVSSNH